MLPDKADRRWVDLVTGKITHQFKSVPAGLCISRNMRSLASDNSQDAVRKSVEEVHAFFAKYENILNDDIAAIFR